MMSGLDKFKVHFQGMEDRYVLIGGTASMLAMEEFGLDFRVTKDLDIVLCIEALDKEFAVRFWGFVKLGGYDNLQKSTGKRLFYRFKNPSDKAFPHMLELFSRIPDAVEINNGSCLTPVPVEEEASSLSGILLDNAYYNLIHERKRVVQGLTIIGAECLIPLKAKAYQNLKARKTEGAKIDSKEIRKHKNDIFRLFQILDPAIKYNLADEVKADLRATFNLLSADETDLKMLGLHGITVDVILKSMWGIYNL